MTQQEADIEIPARRGSITDVNGTDLAVSEPAVDIAATPYLIDDATKVAAQLAPLIGVPEDELLRKLASRARASSTSARGIAGREGRPRREAQDRRASSSSRATSATTRATGRPRSCSAPRAPTSRASAASSTRFDKQLRGADGERRLVKDAMGNPIEMRDTKPVEPGHDVRLTLDANLQDRTEEVLNEVGRVWQPMGATAIVMDPNSGAILALANWPRVNANALEEAPRLRAPEPRDRRDSTSPARPSRR